MMISLAIVWKFLLEVMKSKTRQCRFFFAYEMKESCTRGKGAFKLQQQMLIAVSLYIGCPKT